MSPTRSDARPTEGAGWRPREIAAAVVFLAVLVFQAGVPLQRLAAVAAGEPAPARFGWQMYSRAPDRSQVAVVFGDGREQAVEPSSLLVQPRAEVPIEELLAALCSASPRVRSVAVTPAGGPRRTLPCP